MPGGKVNVLRHGTRQAVGPGLGRTTSSTSDGYSPGPGYQGEDVGGDFLEMGGSGPIKFGAPGFKSGHFSSSSHLCFVLHFLPSSLRLYERLGFVNTAWNQGVSHALERAAKRRSVNNSVMVAAVAMGGTSGQRDGPPCGETEVPMECTREL